MFGHEHSRAPWGRAAVGEEVLRRQVDFVAGRGGSRPRSPRGRRSSVYAPWGSLALFYRDFTYTDDLIRLGHLAPGAAEVLAAARHRRHDRHHHHHELTDPTGSGATRRESLHFGRDTWHRPWREAGPRRVRRALAARLDAIARQYPVRFPDPYLAARHLILLLSPDNLVDGHDHIDPDTFDAVVRAGVKVFLYGYGDQQPMTNGRRRSGASRLVAYAADRRTGTRAPGCTSVRGDLRTARSTG